MRAGPPGAAADTTPDLNVVKSFLVRRPPLAGRHHEKVNAAPCARHSRYLEMQSMNLMNLPVDPESPKVVTAVVEVPYGSSNKYEYDAEYGVFRLDRVLYSPMHYPGEYGFVPRTLARDGDPLDVLVLSTEPTHPGTVIRARPLAFLEMIDGNAEDQKVLAVPVDDPRYERILTLEDVAPHTLREIEHFFAIYKELEGKVTTIGSWRGLDDTHALIRESLAAYVE
jgi:inorganic pyrophosphatase